MADLFTLGPGKNLANLTDAIDTYLKLSKEMDTQVLRLEGGSVIIQARDKGGTWKQWIGMDKAITVKIERVTEDKIMVDIGNAKWADKAGAMAVSLVILWPLTITSGIGIYQQGKLPAEIKNEVYRYLTA